MIHSVAQVNLPVGEFSSPKKSILDNNLFRIKNLQKKEADLILLHLRKNTVKNLSKLRLLITNLSGQI